MLQPTTPPPMMTTLAVFGWSMARSLSRLRRHLLQPEVHVHLAVHGRSDCEVFLRLVPLSGTPVQPSEAEMAVSGERTHAELVSQLDRAPIVGRGFSHAGRIAAGGHVAEETKGIDLVAALLVLAS